ncbi:uncharacterized mitochondrial protein AtMg00810-like [Lathyrus oleraceus]|uniref:uncharacterized mitochondrial protein AtMg00810-like n=1 Tax=Pisum sativum TaxID=3888 RepID=UPI0021D313EE|nr:uncharacterized mitochondrial protein AtMg00810-like [Pisum sativum]
MDEIVLGGISLVGELTNFLGFQVKQIKDNIFVSQSKYAKNIIKMFGLENARHKHIPASIHVKITKDDQEVNVDQSLSRSIIGSLLYLTTSHPDIIFYMGGCPRQQANPKMSHLTQVLIMESCTPMILTPFLLDIVILIG